VVDLPIEDKIDLKDALDKLIKNKQDAIQVMIYVTMKWKLTAYDIARETKRLQLKGRDKIVIMRPS
jgi:hypothetical protein